MKLFPSILLPVLSASWSLLVLLGWAALPAGAATFVVSSTADDGPGSLRQALADAAAQDGEDTVAFAVPGDGARVIQLLSPLLVDSAVTVDGYTQAGASPNTLASGSDAAIRIEVDASTMNPGSSAVAVASSDVTLRGLAIYGAEENGVRVLSVDNVAIEGCFLGLDAAGAARGNGLSGVQTGNSSNLIVGGPLPSQRNVISANGLNGITDVGPPTLIVNNYIGTGPAGTEDRGNGRDGVFVITPGSLVGGDAASANRIRFNDRAGVGISGPATGVAVLANRIDSNDGLGIDLDPGEGDAVTANDADDADVGGNDRQNFPVVTSVTSDAGLVTVEATLDVPAGADEADYTIQVFASASCDPSQHGEGEDFLGAAVVSLSGDDEDLLVAVPGQAPGGTFVTLTATEDATGNTSEFSRCFVVGGEVALCGDADDGGTVSAGDALLALKTAVGTAECALCRCDVNDSGNVASGDALLILKDSVGQEVTLACPLCT